MHADLWITEDGDFVHVYKDDLDRVTIRLRRAAITMPDATARALVHALLAHYAGKVDFHLFPAQEVEKIDQGLRASLRELDREANNEEWGELGADAFDIKAADAFSERPTP